MVQVYKMTYFSLNHRSFVLELRDFFQNLLKRLGGGGRYGFNFLGSLDQNGLDVLLIFIVFSNLRH